MIISLLGSDTYRSLKTLRQLKEKYAREVDAGGINITELSGKDITLEKTRAAVLTQSFLVKKRLVILKYPEETVKETQDELHAFLSGDQYPADNLITIIVSAKEDKRLKLFQFFNKQKHCFRFDPLEGKQLEQWILKEANGSVALDRASLQKLISYCGNETWRLAAELKKLSAYCAGRTATEADVTALVADTCEQSIFDLVDALGGGKTERAIALLAAQVDAGVDPNYVVTMLARQIRIISGIRALAASGVANERDIASRLSIHPFVAKKAKAQSQNFTDDRERRAWDGLVALDRAIKRSRGKPETAFQRFLLSVS